MITPSLELELQTGVWTNVAGDLIRDRLRWSRGISGSGPTDRVAGPGFCSFALDNSAQNTAGVANYYRPGHASCVSGFTHGIRMRLKLTNADAARYVWAGRLRSIDPDPPLAGLQVTACVCVDKFADFADLDMSKLELMESATVDEALEAIFDIMQDPPIHTDLDAGSEELPFLFDDLGGGSISGSAVAANLMISEFGALYGRGDDTDGETWRFENRTARALADVEATFTSDDFEDADDVVRVPSTLEEVYNDAEVQTVPRRSDAAATSVLVQLDAAIAINVGESQAIFVDYRDPNNAAVFVGGKDMVAPVANTDWTANADEDGGGSDLTASCTVTPAFFGSRMMLTLANGAGVTAYIRGVGQDGMQVRGRGLYRYAPVTSRGTNATSIADKGTHQLPQPIVMCYQSSRAIGQAVADYIAQLYGGSATPRRGRLATDTGGDLETLGVTLDVGSRVALDASITKTTDIEAFIHRLDQELDFSNGRLYTTYELAPADTTDILVFDDPARGVLDANAFGFL